MFLSVLFWLASLCFSVWFLYIFIRALLCVPKILEQLERIGTSVPNSQRINSDFVNMFKSKESTVGGDSKD